VATRSFHVRGFSISRRPDAMARRGVSPHLVTLALLPIELSGNDGIVRGQYFRLDSVCFFLGCALADVKLIATPSKVSSG
jgi:hypothetical protein